MTFQEPKVDVVNIDANANMFAESSTGCTTDANANPSFQSCSVGSAHEKTCFSESDDWVD